MHSLQISLLLRSNTLRIETSGHCLTALIQRSKIKVAQQYNNNSRYCCCYCKSNEETTENWYIAKKFYHVYPNPFSGHTRLLSFTLPEPKARNQATFGGVVHKYMLPICHQLP